MTSGQPRLTAHVRDELTPRQREVMELIAAGKTNFEIAQALDITLEGAKYHVSEILSKFGVSSREEAVAAWQQRQRPLSRLARFFGPLTAPAWLRPILTAGAVLVLAALGVLLVLAATGSDESDEGASPADSLPDATATPFPPDNVPESCPAGRARVVHPAWGPAIGDGPVYASFGPPMESGQRTLTFYPPDPRGLNFREGYGGRELMIIVEASYQEPVTISATRLDAPGEMEFIGPSQAILLPPGGGPTGWPLASVTADGWRNYLPAVQLPLDAGGCYAFDFTGSGLNERIVVWAELDPAGPPDFTAEPPVCGTPDPNSPAPITEWIGFVRVNGVSYIELGWLNWDASGLRPPTLSVDPSRVGRQVGHVRWNVADRRIHSCHAELDGASTYLPPGSAVHALTGYREDFRVVAETPYGWRTFESDWREGARTAAGLLDIRGKVISVHAEQRSGELVSNTWELTDRSAVDALVNRLLDEPLSFSDDVERFEEPRIWFRFMLEDGTQVSRFWFVGPQPYSSGIPVSQAFLDSVADLLDQAQ